MPRHVHTAFIVVALIAIVLQGLILLNALFGPDLAYRIDLKHREPPDSAKFRDTLEVITDSQLRERNRCDVFTNGNAFYPAALEAIRAAQNTINIEAYIFQRGEIARRYVQALAERARAGVKVKLIVDYVGSLGTTRSFFRELLDAGGRLEWYNALGLSTIPNFNNRTHRELMIVDGLVGFIGGAGIADNWYKGRKREPPWRDTVVRVKGPAVAHLQASFAENWLRTAGEILTGDEYFQCEHADGGTQALVVSSTPAAGSTRARILFQMLIASAQRTIHISSPYFLPDRSARDEMRRAIRERGLEIKVLVPGKRSDQRMTRASSRRLYGTLLKAGVRIYEYQPAMIHVKALLIDGLWCVVGSTNFDHRSFDLNDEVNLAVMDAAVAERLEEDFQRDLASSREITYAEWRKSTRFGPTGWLGWVLERQE